MSYYKDTFLVGQNKILVGHHQKKGSLRGRRLKLGVKERGFLERFEPGSHFISRLSLIVRVNVVLNRTVVVDSD